MSKLDRIKNIIRSLDVTSTDEEFLADFENASIKEIKEAMIEAKNMLLDIYDICFDDDEWVPVSERLPEEHKTIIGSDMFIDPSEEVLVQMKSGYMKVSRYWGSRERYKDCPWIDLSYPTTDEVIAWMPLPERYKENE